MPSQQTHHDSADAVFIGDVIRQWQTNAVNEANSSTPQMPARNVELTRAEPFH
jgi:hypothetical protein